MSLPRIMGGRLMIKQIESADKTDGGVILPDTVKDDADYLNNIGQVVAVGNCAYQEWAEGNNKFGGESWCSTGDWVVWPRHAGQKFLWRNEAYVILGDDQVIMTVEDPSDFGNDVYKVKYKEQN